MASSEGTALLIELRADACELGSLLDQVDGFAKRHAWTEQLAHDIRLVVEELTLNAMTYGHQSPETGWIRWRISHASHQVTLVMEDGGRAFNPLAAAPPDLDSELEDKQLGGLGIHLVRSLMSPILYERDGNANRLTLFKHTRPTGDA